MSCDRSVYKMTVFRDTGRPLVCTPIILTSFPVAAAQRPVITLTYYLSNILDKKWFNWLGDL